MKTQSINALLFFLILFLVSGNCWGRQLSADKDNVRVLRFCRQAILELDSPIECSLKHCQRQCSLDDYRSHVFGRCNYSTMKCDCYGYCGPQ
ncbi:unnamed protein product [Linum tenue]|uniref:Uncharacterized protein n=1 Tax=Linum tenue TaxID=586396 RepID=A0AAV0KS08_9ROSI|nr:unnamed protein product [Linum tenue]